MTKLAVVVALLCSGLLVGTDAAGQLPTNNDPSNQIRFHTPTEADAKRQQLTNFIWSAGLPTDALPAITSNLGSGVFSGDLLGINQALVSQVTKLDANVSNFDFHSRSYLLTPANAVHKDRVVIVHQGHAHYNDRFDSGVGSTVNALLTQGFSVNIMQQPLFGWNNDNTAIVPGQGALYYGTEYAGHQAIIDTTGPAQGGMGFRLFLEPVIQAINYLKTLPSLIDISMTGISGGGWTTSLIAAIDTRISLSVPVAGSAPLYVRNGDPSSIGDFEQFYAPLFDENIATDGSGGGVATWMEIYALGGYGAGRDQIMVTNQFDNCCYAGSGFATTFKDIVSNTVDLLGQGNWDYYLDSSATVHQIAPNTLSRVLFPALGVVRTIEDLDPVNRVPEPSSAALLLVSLLCQATLSYLQRRRGQAPRSGQEVPPVATS